MQELRIFKVSGDKDEKVVCESNWNRAWKNPGSLLYPRGETLFGLDCSQWHRATETLEFVHLLLGQSSLETVSANGAACSGTILARISSQKTVVNNFCLTSPLLLPSTP